MAKNSVELILEGVVLDDKAKEQIRTKISDIVRENTAEQVAFILEKKLAEAKLNIYKAVKARAKVAFMEALGLVREETQKDAIGFKQQLEEKLSDFLNFSLKKMIPEDVIKEASQARHYKALVEKVKKVIVIDEITKDSEVREAVNDANSIIEKLKQNNNKLMKEKIRMHNRCRQVEAELHLGRKMIGLTDTQKKFVSEALKGKAVEEINNLFDSTLTLMKENKKAVTPTVVKTVKNPTIVTEETKRKIEQNSKTGAPVVTEAKGEMGSEMEDYISVVKDADAGK